MFFFFQLAKAPWRRSWGPTWHILRWEGHSSLPLCSIHSSSSSHLSSLLSFFWDYFFLFCFVFSLFISVRTVSELFGLDTFSARHKIIVAFTWCACKKYRYVLCIILDACTHEFDCCLAVFCLLLLFSFLLSLCLLFLLSVNTPCLSS